LPFVHILFYSIVNFLNCSIAILYKKEQNVLKKCFFIKKLLQKKQEVSQVLADFLFFYLIIQLN